MSDVINISDYMDKLKDPAIDSDLDTDIIKPNFKDNTKESDTHTFESLIKEAKQKIDTDPKIIYNILRGINTEIFKRSQLPAEKLGIDPLILGYIALGTYTHQKPNETITTAIKDQLKEKGLID